MKKFKSFLFANIKKFDYDKIHFFSNFENFWVLKPCIL